MQNSRLIATLVLLAAVATPLSAQIKVFKAGDPAKAAEVNQNFTTVNNAANAAGSLASAAKTAADEAKALATGAQTSADGAQATANAAQSTANTAKTTADSALSKANGLQNRTDLTGANIRDNTLEARDLKTNVVSSVDGVISDGGNIDLRPGTGITISPNTAGKYITISGRVFNGGTITNQLSVERSVSGTSGATGVFSRARTSGTGAMYGGTFYAGTTATSAPAYGIYSQAQSKTQEAIGVKAYASSATTAKFATGVYGYNGGPGTNKYAVYAAGKFAASSKSFIHPHPKDSGKLVEFMCLEGNESGTYFRGTGQLIGGKAKIDIPKEWQLVTGKQKLTVHLTPIRSLARLAVWDQTRENITVRGDENCKFNYIVHGVRRGFDDYKPIKPNAGEYRPELMGVPYGQQYSKPFRDLLIENGTLNADYTPNLQNAMRRGWTLREPTIEEIQDAQGREAVWQSYEKAKAAKKKVR